MQESFVSMWEQYPHCLKTSAGQFAGITSPQVNHTMRVDTGNHFQYGVEISTMELVLIPFDVSQPLFYRFIDKKETHMPSTLWDSVFNQQIAFFDKLQFVLDELWPVFAPLYATYC